MLVCFVFFCFLEYTNMTFMLTFILIAMLVAGEEEIDRLLC